MSTDPRGTAILGFIDRVRTRLVRHLLWRVAAWSCLAGALLATLAALGIVATGRSVPAWVYLAAGATALLGGLATWFALRPGREAAAAAADRRFQLHDALVSFLGFQRSGRDGGLYRLQADHTAAAVEQCDPASVSSPPPRRVWALALACCLAAAGLGFIGESERRVQQRLVAEETLRKTEAIKHLLEQLAEDLKDELGSDELGDGEGELDELIEELAGTEDPETAMRQYAELERELRERQARMDPREEQQLLDRAAEELERGPETQELAQALKRRDYEAAARELEEMKPDEASDPAQRLSEEQKRLARLKAAAQRMAQAARSSAGSKQQAGGAGQSGSSANANASGSGRRSGQSGTGSGAAGGGAAEDGELDQLLEQLEAATLDYEDALEASERELQRLERLSPEQLEACKQANQNLARCVGSLSQRLRRIDTRMRASERLAMLRRQLGACQSFLSNQESQSLAAAMAAMRAQQNSLPPGAGDGGNPEHGADGAFEGGVDRVTGKKGQGPSRVSVEAADSGDAVSGRTATARQRSFDRQLESFVAREDVPEALKHGVKAYFETVHQVAPPSAATPAQPQSQQEQSFDHRIP